MQRKSYITQHSHLATSRGDATYASVTAMKSSPNELMDLQMRAAQLLHRSTRPLAIDHSYLQDEDSDERTIYFSKGK